MSRTTIGEVLSRIRNQIKAVRQDAFLTDRFIYSVVSKHTKWLMKREDAKNKLMGFASVVQTLDIVNLIEVDRIEAGCAGITSGFKIMRTKEHLPAFMQGYWGPLIRQVTSIDGQIDLQPINPTQYVNLNNSKNFKYNKTFYYWYLNDYLYFPNVEWAAVRIEGIFEDDISNYKCIDCVQNNEYRCITKQNQSFNVPDYLFGEIEAAVLKDFTMLLQIPSDPLQDTKSTTR